MNFWNRAKNIKKFEKKVDMTGYVWYYTKCVQENTGNTKQNMR